MNRARDSMKMGTIERGVEAACESIPQWTAQIYIIGISNRISVIQLVSLLSSILGATYCVIGTIACIRHTTGRLLKGRTEGLKDLQTGRIYIAMDEQFCLSSKGSNARGSSSGA